MLSRTYDNQVCSIARSLEVVGERWTVLILRDAFLGLRRFDEFQRSLGIARNVLSDRLDRLVDEGIFERRLYNEHPPRSEYRLTDRGRDLFPTVFSLMRWGDKHAAPGGPPRVVRHRGCGGAIDDHLRCERCGEALTGREVETLPGPGAAAATR
ncbi:MAG TPA: helix-turn-helix domain-containing protein [Solirubrobacteraceae bacterium]|nr:helix-turn-helix domain-containing protein [Solirubrobacteraceae bacterium]